MIREIPDVANVNQLSYRDSVALHHLVADGGQVGYIAGSVQAAAEPIFGIALI